MDSNLYLSVAPTDEPISIGDVKGQARITHIEEDAYLIGLIKAARQWGEAVTGRAFVTQTWQLKLPYFPNCAIELPKPPLISVTSVKYLNTAGTETTWAAADYIVTGVAAEMTRGRIEPASGISYPSTLDVPDAVRIVFVAGFGAAAAVPQGIKVALAKHVAAAFLNRENPDFSGAEREIWPWVSVRFD